MQNAAPLYCTIKKIQRFEDRVIWRVYGRFSRAITPFFSPGCASHQPSMISSHLNLALLMTLNVVQVNLHLPFDSKTEGMYMYMYGNKT